MLLRVLIWHPRPTILWAEGPYNFRLAINGLLSMGHEEQKN